MAPAIDKHFTYTYIEEDTTAPSLLGETRKIVTNVTYVFQSEATDLSDLYGAGYVGTINTCHVIEYFFLLCHTIIPSCYLFLGITRSVVHRHLQTIVCAFVFQSYPMALARFLLILHERGCFPDSTVFLGTVSLIRSWYVVSLFMTKVAALIERLIAAYYVETYEKNCRYSIPIILILCVHLCSIPVAFLMLLGIMNYMVLFESVMLSQLFVIPVMVIIYKLNSRASRSFTRNKNSYSLSMRYQIHENFRVLRLTIKMLVMATVLLVIAGAMMFVKTTITAPIATSIVGLVYQIFMTALPLSEFVVFILAFREWRAHLFGMFGCKDTLSSRTSVVDHLDSEQHFDMLARTWQ